jgi:hypothetical protein
MDARKTRASERHATNLSRGALAVVITAAALALVLPSAAPARGSLRLFVDPPSPACDPELTFPGECKFQFEMTTKVHQPKKCRTRDIKIFRLDPPVSGEVWTTHTVPHKRFSETIEADALYPGDEEFLTDANEAIGGTQMLFRAKAPRERGVAGPLGEPFVCKKLKTPGITQVTVPTPPPPE